MWLDRLSGTSTPAPRPNASSTPQSRSYSPAPRRSSRLLPQAGPQRPNFSPRSSSLSAVSNDSTTSLLGNSRKPTDSFGSNLKSTTLTYSDPIQVLDKLLDIDLKSSLGADKDEIWDNDELIGDVDFTGLTLHEFVGGDQVNDSQVSNPPEATNCWYSAIDHIALSADQILQMRSTKLDLRNSINLSVHATTFLIRLN